MIYYPGIDEAVAIHQAIMDLSGSKAGIFSFTLLHSAIERPKATFSGEDLYPTLEEKAAALIHSLIRNHPFADGNKRTALAVMVRFLTLNGVKMKHPRWETVKFTLNIQKKNYSFIDIVSWIKKHIEET